MFTCTCFGIAFATPDWWGQVKIALALQMGGMLFLCDGAARSIAPPPGSGNFRRFS
jgi:hypothetical protein